MSRWPVAVILAGGLGTRFGDRRPKQLLEIGGRTILEHSVAAFEAASGVAEMLLVMAPGFTAEAERIVQAGGYRKVRAVIAGGSSRSDSTRKALAALGAAGAGSTDGKANCGVLFHDAARPLVDARIIADCVRALEDFAGVTTAMPATDTVLAVEGGLVTDIPDRARLYCCQTPQAFRLDTIVRAHQLAAAQEDDFEATDDCGVVRRYLPDVPIAVVRGSERNLKITTRGDLALASALLAAPSENRL